MRLRTLEEFKVGDGALYSVEFMEETSSHAAGERYSRLKLFLKSDHVLVFSTSDRERRVTVDAENLETGKVVVYR